MGGFFGAISRKDCKYDVFFGTDYHSHLGAKRAGLTFYDDERDSSARSTALRIPLSAQNSKATSRKWAVRLA